MCDPTEKEYFMAEELNSERSVKLTLRLQSVVYEGLEGLAKQKFFETNAYIQYVLARHVIDNCAKADDEIMKLDHDYKVIDRFVELAKICDTEEFFDENFILNVFRKAMEDKDLRELYELAVGGGYLESGLPGKTPLNMYLGWYLKNAIDADPKLDANGKAVRAQVKNAPIQSYTLLVRKK